MSRSGLVRTISDRSDVGVRVLGAAAGLTLLVIGLLLGAGPSQQSRQLQRAPHCADVDRCIVAATATVVAHRKYQASGAPSGGDPGRRGRPVLAAVVLAGPIDGGDPFPGPPAPQPNVPDYNQPDTQRVSTHYSLTLRRTDGRADTLDDVTKALYKAAQTRSDARLDLWRGHITRITIGTTSEDLYGPTDVLVKEWLVAWVGWVLFITAASGVTAIRDSFFDGWGSNASRLFSFSCTVAVVGGLAWACLSPSWPAVWWIVPVVVVGATVVLRAVQQGVRWWQRPTVRW